MLLSTAVVVLLGTVLTLTLNHRIERRAQIAAEKTGEVIAVAGVEEHVAPRYLQSMSTRDLDAMDALLRTQRLRSTGVQRLKLFNADGRIVYSDHRGQIGRNATDSPKVRDALAGRVVSEVVTGAAHDGTGARLIEVFVPLTSREHGRPVGAVEVYLPYDPVAAAITADTRFTQLVVALGLLVLWLALFRIVQQASRALRRQAERNRHQAHHDALTGLPNRRALHERAAALLESPGTAHGAALLLIDLDGFKEINDTLGHHHGDRLLCELGARLARITRPQEVLARLGGDEFALVTTGVADPEAAAARAAELLAVLHEPVTLSAFSVRVEASVGIALHGRDGNSVEQLLQHADVAMYSAKETHGHVQVYAKELDPYSHDRLRLAGELREGIARGELTVYYQPIVDAADGRVYGAEALVRWHHPERGVVAPGDFLPLAERTGEMKALTRVVIEQAVQDAYRWQQAGRNLHVAVNLANSSAHDLELPDLVESALQRWPLSPGLLTLELSEDTVISDPQRVEQILIRLNELGVRLALDDFGTGKASLGHLRRMPLHELKIDRSFVMRILEHPADLALVQAIVALADGLRLQTVGEGVEDGAVADTLAQMGCKFLQGFHYSRPVPLDEFEQWLAGQRQAPDPVPFVAKVTDQASDAPEAAPSRPLQARSLKQ